MATKEERAERDAELMKQAKKVRREERLHCYYTSKDADGWIEFFKALQENYQGKEDVVFVFKTFYDYGEEFCDLFAEYEELETPKEVKQRLKEEERQKKWREQRFKELKKEFEGKNG